MDNIGNSECLFQDVSEVEDFKATFGARLTDVFRDNCGICNIQALLEGAITRESSRTVNTLTSSILESLEQLENPIVCTTEALKGLVLEALRGDEDESENNCDSFWLRQGEYGGDRGSEELNFDL